MTLIERIIADHSDRQRVSAGDIVDISIDVRIARDFGGANVVQNIEESGLGIDDPDKTFFTFDCNPTGSDQKYAANQQVCREFARDNGIRVYDINAGIGTHLVIDRGLAYPGSTVVSTDSHANILGSIGAFGQGMGDQDIAAVWAHGSTWFKVPKSIKITFRGKRPDNVYAKDMVLNMLDTFGANTLLGYSIELYGDAIEGLTLDERITISSMATEMGAVIVLIPPSEAILHYFEELTGRKIEPVRAGANTPYEQEIELDIGTFRPMVARPGHPHATVDIETVRETKIDSVFIGSCTNGRFGDMQVVARILKGKKVAPGVVLKIVPATDDVWEKCLDTGLMKIFKEAGALVGNAGCAGCAAGQVGQNGPGEVTVSTGNRNFAGKQGKGLVYLASPSIAAASAIAGYITTTDDMPDNPAIFIPSKKSPSEAPPTRKKAEEKPVVVEGKVWIIEKDDIDTDMIFHNRYLTITNLSEMGQYTFDNLEGWENFASKAEKGDIVITEKNFGAGSSRQQAVDCFKSLGVQAVIARSFGAIYERNAINAAFPILTYDDLSELDLNQRDRVRIDFKRGTIKNLENDKIVKIREFSDVQMNIYKRDGLLRQSRK